MTAPFEATETLSAEELAQLFEAARAVLPNAHAPYSRFPVAAALLTEAGRIFVGVNVENAAFPLCTCAEQSTVAAAVTGGERRWRALLILTAGEEFAFPCGACRQILNELGGDLPITLARLDRSVSHHRLGTLLPHAFGPDDLT